MTERHQDWLAAASCHEGPSPSATFADLPQEHQNEVVRFGLVAAASITFFVGIGLLLTRLPSRNLAAHVALPDAVPARPAALEARLATEMAAQASARVVPARTVRLRPAFEAASLKSPVTAITPASAPPASERRRNIFSRLFRGIVRRGAPQVTARADAPY